MESRDQNIVEPEIKSRPLVSIIIVYYNTLKDTLELLDSIKKLTYPLIEVIIVDNANDLRFKEKINRDYTTVTFVQSKNNVGFAAGNNLGIQVASGKYLLFLNSDTLVFSDFLEPMIDFLELHPEVGMASPKVLYPDGKTIQYAGARAISPYTGRGKRLGLGEIDQGQYDLCYKTELGHGASLIVSRTTIQKIGFWPEIYFLYYEEHDWCEQAKRAGLLMYYLGNSKTIHKEALSTGGLQSPLKVYYMTRNRLLFMRRNSSGVKLFIGLVFYFLISAPKDFLKYLISGQFNLIYSFFGGIFWHLKPRDLKIS
jgi:GT2 family glycosyltransferase